MKILGILFGVLFSLTGCATYLWHVPSNYLSLLADKVPIQEALETYDLSPEDAEKLKITSELKTFAQEKLQLDINEDLYSEYIQLDRPYVTYLLRVSRSDELKAHIWDMPFVGKVPYIGFFSLERAEEEEKKFSSDEYDTYIRGVSAFSTLNWFDDPVLSSMLSYSLPTFVNIIFHELAHSLLFFKDHINFNERFAEFVGRKATLKFFLEKEGPDSLTVQNLEKSWQDEIIFSEFISKELQELQEWYLTYKDKTPPISKEARIQQIQTKFTTFIKPQLQTNRYDYFSEKTFNNAELLPYRSYTYQLSEFEALYNHTEQNLKLFIEALEPLEDADNPEEALTQKINSLKN